MPASNSADLVLLRHGIAEPRLAGQDHPDRALTAAGRQHLEEQIDGWGEFFERFFHVVEGRKR